MLRSFQGRGQVSVCSLDDDGQAETCFSYHSALRDGGTYGLSLNTISLV